jgi:hypothetical protein
VCCTGDNGGLKVQEIDAYWLQRRISTSLGGMEAAASQRLAQEVFEALQVRLNSLGFTVLSKIICHKFISPCRLGCHYC